ncbi:MAG TPA: hypothetical protein VMT17_06340 [Anaeromyxobacteraceae bacterium]|nr:hypothetical protein [Anaeromyxobacteraceae bacterium]
MTDLEGWVARRYAEARATPVVDARSVTPSVRDLGSGLRCGRRDLVSIPVVRPADDGSARELAARALSADVAALAFSADPAAGSSLAAARAASDALPSTPLLRIDPVVSEGQVLESRLAGADAVAVPSGLVPADDVRRLARVARATMMTPVFIVRSSEDWTLVREADPRFVLAGGPGFPVARALALAAELPPQVAVCLWADGVGTPADVRALLGRADGVLLDAGFPVTSWGEVAVVDATG